MTKQRLLFLLVVVACQGGICGGGGGPPAPDSCSGPMLRGPVDALELGTLDGDMVFKPLADGDQVTVLTGPQGGNMFAIALRITGDSVPECLQQKTRASYLAGGRQEEVSLSVPLTTYPTDAARARITRTSYVIFDAFPDAGPATLTAEAAGQTVVRTISFVR